VGPFILCLDPKLATYGEITLETIREELTRWWCGL